MSKDSNTTTIENKANEISKRPSTNWNEKLDKAIENEVSFINDTIECWLEINPNGTVDFPYGYSPKPNEKIARIKS